MSLPVVAIVGRPNVGKSTLFNRLLGFRKAVVDDQPGVTRDRLYEEAVVDGRRVLLIDTGGLEPEPDTDLLLAMRRQSLVAVEEADVIVFVVDARKGVTPADADVAELLRRSRQPVILAANKCDGPRHDDLIGDLWSFGIVPIVPISAEHGRGIYELSEAIGEALPEGEADADEQAPPDVEILVSEEDEDEDTEPVRPGAPAPHEIRIAVIGRPNLGKSTLVNALLGEERHLVFDMPGTTMDPVDSRLEVRGKRYLLVDTAGVRKRNRIDTQLERFVSLRSIRAIERCHVALLIVDGTEGITDQDAKLARLVSDRGRALVVLVNKWDLAKEDPDINSHLVDDDIARRLPHAVWAPHLFISAKTGKGVHRVLPMVDKAFAAFDTRISTARLNRFLEESVAAHSPPQVHHHPVRLYYATQIRVRPPTIAVFTNTPDGVTAAYQRYLTNRLRETFDLEGSPVRMHIKRRRKLGEDKA